MTADQVVALLSQILNWTRAASFRSVKALLEEALPEAKSRKAFQMLDGSKSMDQVRIACKISPNAIGALTQKCVAMGLMEVKEDKRRVRLFDLNDFGMNSVETEPEEGRRR